MAQIIVLRSIQRVNTQEIPQRFLPQGGEKKQTLGLFCLLRTGTVGTNALKMENYVFIPKVRVKIKFETRTWQFHSRQKFTLPNYFLCIQPGRILS